MIAHKRLIPRKLLLQSAQTKINRANQHVQDFILAEKSFITEKAYEILKDANDQTGEVDFRLRIAKETPQIISAIVGDAVHNFRSALDHIACACIRLRYWNHLCVHGSIAFPIEVDTHHFESHIGRYIGKAVPRLKSTFERFQPYMGAEGRTLTILKELDDRDKHRHIILAHNITLDEADVEIILGELDPLFPRPQVNIPLSEEMIRFSKLPIVISDPYDGRKILGFSPGMGFSYPDMQIKLHAPGFISFSEPRSVDREAVLPLLEQFSVVLDKVLNAFRPHFVD